MMARPTFQASQSLVQQRQVVREVCAGFNSPFTPECRTKFSHRLMQVDIGLYFATSAEERPTDLSRKPASISRLRVTSGPVGANPNAGPLGINHMSIAMRSFNHAKKWLKTLNSEEELNSRLT
jgi:hypothetical protein